MVFVGSGVSLNMCLLFTAYDVLTNTATPVTLQKVLSSSAALTYAAWISLRKSSWNEEFFRLAAAQGTSTIVCKYTSSIEMEING